MKRKFKLIVPSFLTLIFCLLLIAGSTFAIFSSQDEASIEVTSGKVKMTADLTGLQAYSVEATDGTGNAGSAEAFGVTSNYNYVPATPVVENQSYKFANGGLVNFNEEKTLILSNVTPGDRITLKLTLTNDSNVDIKYRVRLNATEDNGLLEGLTFKMQEGTNEAEEFVGVIKVGNWTPWSAPANNDAKVKEINLELVLPVDAGNEYQEKTAKLRFTVEALQANAKVDTLLEEVNAYLANATNQSAKVNKTMHDAKAEAEAYKPAFDAIKYLWNIDTDQFYAEDNVVTGQGFEGRFFKAYTEDSMPALADQKFSIYATGAWTNLVNVVVGFDAGDATGISSVSYVRNGANDKAQEVVIRTNSASTAITINAPKDIVHHYGVAGSLDIIAVAGQSYHEFGTVGFIQIAKGRVALEKDSSVNQLHFDYNETAQKFDEIVVAVDSTVTLPKLSRDVVENIGANGTLVVELQDNTNAEQANSDYIWLYQQGVINQIVVTKTEEFDNSVKATDSNISTNTYKAADDISNNFADGKNWNNVVKDENGNITTESAVVESGLDSDAKADAKDNVVSKFYTVLNNTTSKGYFDLASALAEVVNNQEIEVVKDIEVKEEIDLYYSASEFAMTLKVAAGKELHFSGNGQIKLVWQNGHSCIITVNGTGTISSENSLPMITSDTRNEVIESYNVTVSGGKYSDLKVRFNSGHYDTLISGVVNTTNTTYSVINGGTFKQEPTNVPVKSGFKVQYNETTHVYEVAEDIPTGAIFAIISNDPNVSIKHITTGNFDNYSWFGDYIPGNCTVKLLTDYTYAPADKTSVLGIGGDNITFDLNGHTLTFDSYNVSGMFADDHGYNNIQFISSVAGGRIVAIVSNNVSTKQLFYSNSSPATFTVDTTNLETVNVTY